MTEVTDVKAPVVESKQTEAKVEPKVEATAAPEANVGELLQGKEAVAEPKMVPESALIEYKKENKVLLKELKKTQDMIAEGATKKEVSASLKAIAEEYKVDEGFLTKLSALIKADAEADVDERVSSKLKPIQEKENATRIDKIFSEHYDKTLEAMPEYKDIANRGVIKSLTLDPANANKTFAQILENAYGHLLPKGKRTLDAAKAGGDKEPAAVDFRKAKSDPEYFKEIMADPARRKEYNADLQKRLRL
jgi:hypothetical protein